MFIHLPTDQDTMIVRRHTVVLPAAEMPIELNYDMRPAAENPTIQDCIPKLAL